MSLRAYFSILRPVNCAMIGFAVIVGIFVSKPPSLHLDSLALGFVTGFAICAYSMVINDYYDIEVDRVNQPGRPLPSGAISPGGATALALAMLVRGGRRIAGCCSTGCSGHSRCSTPFCPGSTTSGRRSMGSRETSSWRLPSRYRSSTEGWSREGA